MSLRNLKSDGNLRRSKAKFSGEYFQYEKQ